MTSKMHLLRPSAPFLGASWASLVIGVGAYFIGLWNSMMNFSEKGYYFAALVLGLFAAISLQKTVRDKLENVPVTNTYVGVCWLGLLIAISLLVVGLFNAPFELSIKGFYGMAYLLSMFAVVTVQKNIRDLTYFDKISDREKEPHADGTPLREQ